MSSLSTISALVCPLEDLTSTVRIMLCHCLGSAFRIVLFSQLRIFEEGQPPALVLLPFMLWPAFIRPTMWNTTLANSLLSARRK